MNVKGSVFTFVKGGTLHFEYAGSMLPISHASIPPQLASVGYLVSTGQMNIYPRHKRNCSTGMLHSAVGVDTEPILQPKEN